MNAGSCSALVLWEVGDELAWIPPIAEIWNKGLLVALEVEDRCEWTLRQGRAIAKSDWRWIIWCVVKQIKPCGESSILLIVRWASHVGNFANRLVWISPLWVVRRRIWFLGRNTCHITIRSDVDVVAGCTGIERGPDVEGDELQPLWIIRVDNFWAQAIREGYKDSGRWLDMYKGCQQQHL